MNTLLNSFTSPEWAVFVKTLLHTLWQGAAAAAVLAIALRFCRCPAARYRWSMLALFAVPVAGLLTWSSMRQPGPAAFPSVASEIPNALVHDIGGEPYVVARATPVPTPKAKPLPWTAWCALLWISGAGLMLLRAGTQVAGAEKLRRSCQPLKHDSISTLLLEARQALKIRRSIRIAVTEKLTSPAVVGVWMPTLILPLSLVTTLSHEQIRFILLHELAHIRRGDYLANLFQLFTEALFFFNPFMWWISHQIRREREACCDALAIERSGAPGEYAKTLLRVAEHALNPVSAPAFGGHERSSLTDRIQRLLVPGYRPALRLTWRAMAAALLAGSALLILASGGTRIAVAAFRPNTNPSEGVAMSSSSVTNLSGFVIDRHDSSQTNSPHSAAAPANLPRSNADANVRAAVATLIANGKFSYETGDLEAAMAHLKKALTIEPGNTAAQFYFNLATNRMTNGQSRESDGIMRTSSSVSIPASHLQREFKFDTERLVRNLASFNAIDVRKLRDAETADDSSLAEQIVGGALFDWFSKNGIEISFTNISSMDWNYATGVLSVRATAVEMNKLEFLASGLNNDATSKSQNHVRTFTFDPHVFYPNLRKRFSLPASMTDNALALAQLPDLLGQSGIHIGNAFLKDYGLMLLSGSKEDLDKAEKLIVELNGGRTNIPMPQRPARSAAVPPAIPRVGVADSKPQFELQFVGFNDPGAFSFGDNSEAKWPLPTPRFRIKPHDTNSMPTSEFSFELLWATTRLNLRN